MSGVWFGDIGTAWITEKSTDLSKEVIEKNFVDAPPQVYELTPNLESGTYSLILNEQYHPRQETFREQRDGVRSMPSRHGTEFPFELAGDKGYVLPESTSVSITPSEEIEEGEVTLRFLEDETYRPAIKTTAFPVSQKFAPTPEESVLPVPSIAENTPTSDYTVTGENGDMEYYIYSDTNIFEYDHPSNHTEIERVNTNRLFDSSDERVYSDKGVSAGSYVENGLIRGTYNSDNISLEYYDSSWVSIGDITVPTQADGYAKENENYELETEWIDSHNSKYYRGYPMVEVTLDGQTSFDFTSDATIDFIEESADWYRIVQDANGRHLFVVRESDDGQFNVGTQTISVDNIQSSKEYTFYVGVVPSSFGLVDFARYVYNIGEWRRSFVQR
jgi:hypothetical protein